MATVVGVRRPAGRADPLRWLKENLFSSWHNALLTLLALSVIYLLVSNALEWALTSARWETITRNLTLLMVGRYPRDELWRVWSGVYLLSFLAGASWGAWGGFFRSFAVALTAGLVTLVILPFAPDDRLRLAGNAVALAAGLLLARAWQGPRWVGLSWVLALPVFYLILTGQFVPPLPYIAPVRWEGFLLTMMLTLIGIVASFPFGVLLALGRQSKLPVVHWISIAYIELIRGVPLITILIMSQLLLPLFLPGGVRLDRVLRAMVGIILFSAAYQAENVRGGLQAVPEGQREAARSIGLNPVFITLLIVLPQAIRAVIPALVGTAISLFKDTTLVSIVGLLDFLGIGQAITAQPEFLRRYQEVYVFVGFVYWIVSFTISRASRRLEVAMGLGER